MSFSVLFVCICVTVLLPPGGYPIAVKYIISFLKRDSVTLILRMEAEQLPSLIGNVSCFHMKGKQCVIRGEIHAADDGSPHQHTLVCVSVCVCVCVAI